MNDDDLDGKVGDVKITETSLPDGDCQIEITGRIAIPVVIALLLLCLSLAFFFLYRG